MKKILLFLLVFTLFFSLVGCMDSTTTDDSDKDENGETDENDEQGGDADDDGEEGHTHQYGNPEVTYTDKKVTLVYTCVDCGHTKTESQTVDSTLDDALDWNDAFQNFKLTNFTMKVYFEKENEPTHVNHCIITETVVYYHLPESVEYYARKNSDGTYELYMSRYEPIYNEQTEKYTYKKLPFEKYTGEFAQQGFERARVETVLQISFADNFDKFTYDSATATYRANDLIEATYFDGHGERLGELYCYNNEVKVINNSIQSISCDYRFDISGEENEDYYDKHSLEYYNIGISQLSIPEEIIKNAVPGTMDNNGNNNDRPAGDSDNEEQGSVSVPDQQLNTKMLCGEWYFEHYYFEDEGEVIEFSVGESFESYLMDRDSIKINIQPDGTGTFTFLGNSKNFTWKFIDSNTVEFIKENGSEPEYLILKGEGVLIYTNAERTGRITLVR